MKFPNFLSVETKPFDPEVYEDEIEEEEQLDEEGRSRLKLKVLILCAALEIFTAELFSISNNFWWKNLSCEKNYLKIAIKSF